MREYALVLLVTPGIRILYEVDEDAATVYVINVAVTM
jgi:hypothetical protein